MLSGLRTFLINWAISVLYTYFLVILECAILADILDSFKLFFGGGKKLIFHIKILLFFMDVTIFLKKFFNIGVVLNCRGLIYLKAVQY